MEILFKSASFVNKEILRLLCTLTMFTDQTLLWVKCDSKKTHIDYSNYSDILLKYKNRNILLDEKNSKLSDLQAKRILTLPFQKVLQYINIILIL